jgi:putative ABC transport system substrate-binding protein
MAALGGAAVLPVTARAQQPKVPVVGIIDWQGPQKLAEGRDTHMDAFRAGLREAGFFEGRNLSIEYRYANADFGLLRSSAADLVRREVAVIVAYGALAAVRAAKDATPTIPIVFIYGFDPVKNGLVASLSRPGGNVTGITVLNNELAGKRLDLLLKMVPQGRKIGFLSGDRIYGEQTTLMLAAGRALGVEIMIAECRDDRDYEAALAKMVEGGADAMILGNFLLPNLYKVVSLAALHKMPTIYPYRELVRAGGLMSYDTDRIVMYRRLGSAYVARILKGEKPADLPVEQPTKFELVINLKTANALGLTLPRTLFAAADEIIE